MIKYGNARVVPSIGWCCTDENNVLITDENGDYIPANPITGEPKSELPPLCPSCKRPMPRRPLVAERPREAAEDASPTVKRGR